MALLVTNKAFLGYGRFPSPQPPKLAPTLPTEILCIIFALVRCAPDGIRTLAYCCLVSRALLEPARGALYRTLEIRYQSRQFKVRGVPVDSEDIELDFDFREEDVIDHDGAAVALTLLIRPHLAVLVRRIVLSFEYDGNWENSVATSPVFLMATLFRACSNLKELRVANACDGELPALLELIRAYALSLSVAELVDYDELENSIDAGTITHFLLSQQDLEHLTLVGTEVTFISPQATPTFRLQSLRT